MLLILFCASATIWRINIFKNRSILLSLGTLFSTKKLDKMSRIRRKDAISCKFNARCVRGICSSPRRRIVLVVNHHTRARSSVRILAPAVGRVAPSTPFISVRREQACPTWPLPDMIEKCGIDTAISVYCGIR